MEALTVTADLVNGYCSADRWSPSLDGILAYWQLREQLGEEDFALGCTNGMQWIVPEALPLGKEEFGGDWWWQCSMPIATPLAEWARYGHRRFDAQSAERFLATGKSGRVNVAAGPYKIYRMRHQVHITPAVTWHCLGDAAEIARLLRLCFQVGAEGGEGLGAVRGWHVELGGDPNLARFRRPLPEPFAVRHEIAGGIMDWGIRPPGRLIEHRRRCVMP